MLVTGGLELGVFASFMQIQAQMKLGVPWLFPFGITVGALTIVAIIVAEILVAQHRLAPQWVMMAAFVLFVLYLTGLIETAIQLFGPAGNVNGNCGSLVAYTGVSLDTLAYLEQHSICQSWDAAFAFWIVGAVFLVWVFIMASQVNRRYYS